MAGEQRQVKSFSCPNCQAPQTIRGLGQTSTLACQSCGSIIDISNENYQILVRYQRAQNRAPHVPLGQRGELFGTRYEVLGFMVRSDASGMYAWDEYLLFNPFKGFAWLIQYQGHWSFALSTKDIPTPVRTFNRGQAWAGQKLGDRVYSLFLTGQAKVQYVFGEFYWQVKVGDVVAVEDYIAPPYMLSLERDSQEDVWSVSEYLEPLEVAEAFGLSAQDFPPKQGVGAIQPCPGRAWSRGVYVGAFVFVILCALLHMQFSAQSKNYVAFANSYYYNGLNVLPGTTVPENTTVTNTFNLTGRTSNLAVKFTAPVQNNWISFDVDLVRADTGASVDAEAELSFYSGTDSDGSWSEGSQRASTMFESVEPGPYYLSITPSSDPGLSVSYDVAVVHDVPYHGNFALVAILIGIFPILLAIRQFSFEAQRWQQSDFGDDE